MFKIAVPVVIDDIGKFVHVASFMVSFRNWNRYTMPTKNERSYILNAKTNRTFVYVKFFLRFLRHEVETAMVRQNLESPNYHPSNWKN